MHGFKQTYTSEMRNADLFIHLFFIFTGEQFTHLQRRRRRGKGEKHITAGNFTLLKIKVLY